MQFDIVWFTPDRRLDAYRLVKPLSPAEVAGRDQPNPWRLAVPAPLPDVGGRVVGEAAAIVRNFLGSVALAFGAREADRLWLTRFTHFTPLGPGLVGGILQPDFWGVEGVEAMAEDQRAAEEAAAALRPVTAGAHLRAALACVCAVPLSLYAALRAVPISWALWRAERRGPPDPYFAACALMARACRSTTARKA